jgi:hypothetical protein
VSEPSAKRQAGGMTVTLGVPIPTKARKRANKCVTILNSTVQAGRTDIVLFLQVTSSFFEAGPAIQKRTWLIFGAFRNTGIQAVCFTLVRRHPHKHQPVQCHEPGWYTPPSPPPLLRNELTTFIYSRGFAASSDLAAKSSKIVL